MNNKNLSGLNTLQIPLNRTFWILILCLTIGSGCSQKYIQKLFHNQLPFSQETLGIARELILLEETAIFQLYGKTGWTSRVNPEFGWTIGYIEKGNSVHFFATHVEQEESQKSLGIIEKEITIEILKELELL